MSCGRRDAIRTTRVGVDVVSSGFLEALGARLIRGRFVQATDSAGAPRVALVNVSAARAIWGDSDPVGQTIVMDESPLQVIGVVGDIRRLNLELPAAPAIYLSHLQPSSISVNNLLVRTSGDPREVLPAVRTVMRQLDPDQPLTRIATLEERIDEILAPRRFMLRLIGLFSILALGLAMLGVYGVMAESVAQRVPEIGIRVALGATPGGDPPARHRPGRMDGRPRTGRRTRRRARTASGDGDARVRRAHDRSDCVRDCVRVPRRRHHRRVRHPGQPRGVDGSGQGAAAGVEARARPINGPRPYARGRWRGSPPRPSP